MSFKKILHSFYMGGVLAFISAVAMGIGIFSRSIIATIFSGLASYWFLIFVV